MSFDRDDVPYRVLINGQGQYSLWPDGTRVPEGWEVCHGPAERVECVAFVDAEWTDMRPVSVRSASAAARG